MTPTLAGRALAATALALALAVPCTAAHAQDATQVTRLRTEKVTLFDAATNGKPVRDVKRADFKGPWKIVGTSPEKMLQVEVEGTRYWVRPYAVETDAVVRAPAECGAVVAKKSERIGATRGLGEECKP